MNQDEVDRQFSLVTGGLESSSVLVDGRFIAKLARPVIWLLGVSTDIVVRVLGGDPKAGREEVTDEEIRAMVSGSPGTSVIGFPASVPHWRIVKPLAC